MSPPGRPKGEYRSVQHEGTPVSDARDRLTLGRWVSDPGAASPGRPAFMFDRGDLGASLRDVAVVLRSGGMAPARARLAAGARQVLLADGALRDIAVMQGAIAEFGAARVGAWLPLKRMEVGWALDSQSNGDFKCMVPSNPEARWEVLDSGLQCTGTEARACIDSLARLGVTTVLVSVDMRDERDLDLCAGLMQRFGSMLWFSPLDETAADLASWVEFGQVDRLVLPQSRAADAQAEQLLARFGRSRIDSGLAA